MNFEAFFGRVRGICSVERREPDCGQNERIGEVSVNDSRIHVDYFFRGLGW
jgi:hypothetical protein